MVDNQKKNRQESDKIAELTACLKSLSRFNDKQVGDLTPQEAQEFISLAKEYYQLRADPALVSIAGKLEGRYNISTELKQKIMTTYKQTTAAGGGSVDMDDARHIEMMNTLYNDKELLADAIEKGTVKLDDKIDHPELGRTTVGEGVKHDAKKQIKILKDKIRTVKRAKNKYNQTVLKNASALAKMSPEERKKHLDELRKKDPEAASNVEVALEYIEKNPSKAVSVDKEKYSQEDILKSKTEKDASKKDLEQLGKENPKIKKLLEACQKKARSPEEAKEFTDLVVEIGASEKELNLLVAKGVQFSLDGKGDTKDFLKELEEQGKLKGLTAEQKAQLSAFVDKSVTKGVETYENAAGSDKLKSAVLDKVVNKMTNAVYQEQGLNTLSKNSQNITQEITALPQEKNNQTQR